MPQRSSPAPAAGRHVVELLLGAAPTLAFLVVYAATAALRWSVVAAGVAAAVAFGWHLLRREPLRRAVPGVLLVAVCAVVATVTGQARGFFLVPTLVPFAAVVVCTVSIAAGRPLTGLVLNRISGGPADWYRVSRLRRVHTGATLACMAVNLVNAAVQVVFYRADEPVVLGVAHLATGPVFATIVAVTLVVARRAAGTRPAEPSGSCPTPAGRRG